MQSSLPIRTVVGSQVLAVTVGSEISFQNLVEAVTIVFRLQVPKGSVSSLGLVPSLSSYQACIEEGDAIVGIFIVNYSKYLAIAEPLLYCIVLNE